MLSGSQLGNGKLLEVRRACTYCHYLEGSQLLLLKIGQLSRLYQVFQLTLLETLTPNDFYHL